MANICDFVDRWSHYAHNFRRRSRKSGLNLDSLLVTPQPNQFVDRVIDPNASTMTKDRKDSKPWSKDSPKKKKAEPKKSGAAAEAKKSVAAAEPEPFIVDLTNIIYDDESQLSRNLGIDAASIDSRMYATPNRSASTDRMANGRTNVGTQQQPIWVSDEEDESIQAIRGERRSKETPSVSSSQPSNMSRSSASRGSSRTSKTRSQKSSVDMSTLKEDPSLEKELEEIALHSRAGMISGTPSAYDLEKGKNRKPAPRATRYVEDEADKSWHTPLATNQTNNKSRNRKRLVLLLCVLGLLALAGGILYSLLGNEKAPQEGNITPTDEEPATLTDRQQVMHNILVKVTSPSILSDPNTSQHAARRWLLFRDSEIVALNEERIVQRYALACFYFSTGGEDSWEKEKTKNNWLLGHECGDEVWDGLSCNAKGEVRALVFGKWINIFRCILYRSSTHLNLV
jgi:hypothetical protein